MKKFIYKAVVFLAVLATVNISLDYIYKHIIMRDSVNNQKDKQYKDYRKDIKYLFIGDSHIMNGIDPREISGSFNFGSGEESYLQTYYKLKAIIDSTHAEYIILNTDLSSFSSFRKTRIKYSHYWIKYIDYREVADRLDDRTFLSRWAGGALFSYTGNYEHILRLPFRSDRKRNPVYYGYKIPKGKYTYSTDMKKDATDRAAFYFRGFNVVDTHLLGYFTDILNMCRSHGIKVILIKMPLSDQYLEASGHYLDREFFYDELNSETDCFSNIAGWLDYQDFFSGHPEYFNNPDHLNEEGAQLLSSRICTDLREQYPLK